MICGAEGKEGGELSFETRTKAAAYASTMIRFPAHAAPCGSLVLWKEP
jgi:hypothetical protein